MKKRWFFILSLIVLMMIPTGLFADEITETLELYKLSFDAIWLLLGAALVFFMQAGFAMVETGLTRAKNAGNIIMKNLMDFSMGALFYWAIGWAFMYGTEGNSFIGMNAFFLNYTPEFLADYGVGSMQEITRDWFFQVVFAATAATIVSGSMAERTKFSSYLIYSVIISAVIYPISGHWIWGGGWLAAKGFHDFAGSTVVHSLGGWAALMGALILGPRLGKYVKKDGKITVKAILGHNMPLAALGVFILWFGWYGFNAASTLSGTDITMTDVAVTTTLAASAGAVFAMFTTWIVFGKPDVSMSLNGALAGLVGITAGCGVLSPTEAIITGGIAGILVVGSVEFFDKVLHIDDPVGAISVHGICGAWGTLAVGIFGDLSIIDSGLTRAGQIGVQLLGIGSVFLWGTITAGTLFLAIKFILGLRVSEKEELRGLDLDEHGMESYAGFQIFQNM
ncbi:MAG: ammonium transporter [Spirochaetaceae bacterium]|jgi:Amt family ammonium transporter|nr:ammonium transporter [Spirochaetaceae bacterium]